MSKMLTSKQANLENCNSIKAILMLLVVVGHSCDFWTEKWFTSYAVVIECKPLALVANWLSSFHVYGFVLVSGYLFFYLKNECARYSSYSAFLCSKGKRLLIPYCFVMVVWVAPLSSIACSYSWEQMVSKYIFCINPSQLWFLWMLYGVFVVIWPLNKLLKNDAMAIFVSILAWTIGYIAAKFIPNYFCIWKSFDYLPYFILGMKLREKDGFQLEKMPVWLLTMLDFVLFATLQYLSNRSDFLIVKVLSFALSYLIHIVGALMAFFLLQRIAIICDWKNSKLLIFLSNNSMPIYLFHQQVIYFVIILLNGKINPYINALLNFVIALMVSSLISCMLMKYKCTRFLIGEK